jgi:hypothetical protein
MLVYTISFPSAARASARSTTSPLTAYCILLSPCDMVVVFQEYSWREGEGAPLAAAAASAAAASSSSSPPGTAGL